MAQSDPDKPDTSGPETQRRRTFLKTLWGGLGFIAVAEFLWLFFSFLKPEKPSESSTNSLNFIEAGSVDDFHPGTVTAFVRGRFYLCRLDDGGFLALSRRCTHLGCTLPWDDEKQQFICPCHASAFDMAGNVISPPAPRSLDIHPLTIENRMITVNTGKTIQRKHGRKADIVYK